ncbi:Cmx/CmrA family chloramphenicol efflux MFS transporter [Streptomyces niveiscabiei]|uniref:Cmx/CmrA family chloramphenicol efflux MFS transporter n=1 Tax=Streptomyces niveiscabiei TaxID=164115 RepID=A0ABW9I5Q1_9ACTN
MPVLVYLLGLGTFAQGTSEFMLSGLLPPLADDLGVSLPDAGLLVSAFAAGMIVGAPLLTLATLRLPRRSALVGFQAVFVAGHVAAALVPDFGFLLAMRVVTGMAYAGFWALASVAAVSVVPAGRRGKAMSVVVSGLSLSMILGVPAGTLLAQHASWRAAFWAVAVLTALSALAVLAMLPGGRDTTTERPRLRTELRSLAVPRLWVAYTTTALTISATTAVFSYLGALLEDVTGIPESLVPLVLGLYGVGALAGLTLGGRLADRAPFAVLLTGMGTVAAVAATLALTAGTPALTIPLTVLLAAGGFATNPAVNARVFGVLGETRTLGGALNIVAFNVGIAVAPWVSGLVIETGSGLAGIGWVGAGFGMAAMVSALVDRGLGGAAGRDEDRVGGAVRRDGGRVGGSAGRPQDRVGGAARRHEDGAGGAAGREEGRVGGAVRRDGGRVGGSVGWPEGRVSGAAGPPQDRVGGAARRDGGRAGGSAGRPQDRVGGATQQHEQPVDRLADAVLDEPLPAHRLPARQRRAGGEDLDRV